MVDEIHIVISVQQGRSDRSVDSMRQSLNSARFNAELRQALLRLFRRYAPLRKVRVRLER
jgi:hypothetical protein